jgi:uncharacterized protein
MAEIDASLTPYAAAAEIDFEKHQSRFPENPMLELRPSCEGCGRPLPANAIDAMICSYECTFCEVCALTTLRNVCPNCGGNFQHRPIRPTAMLAKNPASEKPHPVQINEEKHDEFFARYRDTPAAQR